MKSKKKKANTRKSHNSEKARLSGKHQSLASSSVPTKPPNSGNVLLPQAFPPHLPRPSDDFLRNKDPYKESYRAALTTAYEGFVIDSSLETPDERQVQACLETMRSQNYFRRDVTQPFGLGSKCAKTYVTRCLLGEPGTTYKYLGIRMFAHPWKDTEIWRLSQTLSQRTQHHLRALDVTRKNRGAPGTKGSSNFDICLINRMEASDDLKDEPSLGKLKTSVSWHADSSLEHYSAIAVYQTLLGQQGSGSGITATNKKNKKVANSNKRQPVDQEGSHEKWHVALRVAHFVEGPNSSRQRGGIDTYSTIVKETPAIAASLPSGSAYYLLDDFNHHHQHTVLTDPLPENCQRGNDVRYSCTFRLLRHSHNVEHILQWCHSTVSNFHKKGPKLWRSEQLLLDELESEWIRQFYIQGRQHHDMLCRVYWEKPIQRLVGYWSKLEYRTKQTIDLLQYAAEGKCTSAIMNSNSKHSGTEGDIPSKAERKIRDKRKKAVTTLQTLLDRNDSDNGGAFVTIYDPIAQHLEDRATMRELWAKRENDHVFTEMNPDCRPMPLPFQFGCPETESPASSGVSPLPATPAKLREIAKALRGFGKAWESGNEKDLPGNSSSGVSVTTAASKNAASKNSQSPDWAGWGKLNFGLELQNPWALAVVNGEKTIETRAYDLPPALVGRKIWIIQSPSGKAGVSSLGNEIDFSRSETTVIGWCTFSSVKKYTTKATFDADFGRHLVAPDSGYGWKEGKTKVIYGWVVEDCGGIEKGAPPVLSAFRRMRSLFELKLGSSSARKREANQTESKTKKRKKRY